ncbi:MAG: hypothetical protein JWO87_1009 [Phycisphaerales bacterium]|nr:hypothetical protein [Phycisphaerales bacterium]
MGTSANWTARALCAAAIACGATLFAADKPAKEKESAPENKALKTEQPAKPDEAVLKPAGDGWLAVLSTKDLSGLKAEPEFWKVEEGGVLHGVTPGGAKHHYSYTEKSDYDNFELHADVKLVGYNSGICIRIAPTDFDNVPGYQVDMGDGYWGCLWDERGRNIKVGDYPKDKAEKILHKNDWNHYYVRANGHHIEMWLNGVKTVDVVDEKGRLTGPIGFQLCHGGSSTDASFKNVVYRPLKAEAGK